MFRALFKDPKFVGAQTSPPNIVMVIMEDGIDVSSGSHLRKTQLISWVYSERKMELKTLLLNLLQ